MESPTANPLGNEQVPESSVEETREEMGADLKRKELEEKIRTEQFPTDLKIKDQSGEMNDGWTAYTLEKDPDGREVVNVTKLEKTETNPPTRKWEKVPLSDLVNWNTGPMEENTNQSPVVENNQKSEATSLEESLKTGQPLYNLKVERSSGEIEDGWFATGTFRDPDGTKRVRVWRESPEGTILRKDVKLEDLSKWNKESPGGLSEKGQQFLRDSDEIQSDLQGRSFKESLTELMKEEDAQKYLEFLARDSGKTPDIQQVFADIDQKLSQTQESLAEIDSRIAGINSQLIEIQASENLTQEQLLEHMRLSQEFQNLTSQRFTTLLEQQKLDSERSRALYEDLINRINGGDQPEIPTTPEVPETPDVPTVPEIPTPGISSAETEQLRQQLNAQAQEIANLRGENTPEQRSAAISRQLAQLDAIKEGRPLTDQEKIQYFDLLEAKKTIDTQLGNIEGESARKRNKKHTIIKVGAFVAGIGVGALTPPVSAAALIAVGLGGPLIGRQGIKLSEKLRAKSNSLKYADRRNKTVSELAQIDKKIKRNEWWANRLGEVSSALMGAGVGYGAGKAIQNIVNMFRTPSTPPSGQTPPSSGQNPPVGYGETPSVETSPPQGSIELPPTQPVSTTSSELAPGDWLKTEELGWKTSEWGWMGPNLYVPQSGAIEGEYPALQREFLDALSKFGVEEKMLEGQPAGEIFNRGLMAAVYRPEGTISEIASATAEALKSLNP